MRKVLVANRGEIAVRIIRACHDFGVGSVAIYADPDRDAPHAQLADEAYALDGSTAAETYLQIEKILQICRKSGADAVHPGYGFLAENAEFAQAVLAAGLTWIGPPVAAIEALGDKVQARHIALAVGAPLVAGTADPVSGPDEVVDFAEKYGVPIAIKAAFGGGGRGLKVAREIDEIPELYASAVREAEAAFGRGECFVEQYLDRPRHVEAQILADRFGNVIVVGTRDCSLQRRHQKLVEEAPAPFLTDEQRQVIHSAAKAICREAGYEGAGTVEFLVGRDGAISFLEVNTRLQVEHPVTEETTGIDLVLEQLRIANGEQLRWTEDPLPRGHSLEFRINGEDPGRDFLPMPGQVTEYHEPSGPGVRVDSGIGLGNVLSGAFDSLLAKVIVTGENRAAALARARRALAEMRVDGIPTVLPFHRAVLNDPAFINEPFAVHTRWIETEYINETPPFTGAAQPPPPIERETIVVEVNGKRLEVRLPGDVASGRSEKSAATPPSRRRSQHAVAASSEALTSPMQGTIVKLAVADGDKVAAGDLVVVIEAMKMEQPLNAHRAGTVKGLTNVVGDVVTTGAVICEIAD